MPITRLNVLTAILTACWCAVAPLSAALSAPRQVTVVQTSRSAVVVRKSPAHGQRDMWQVIDQVGTNELGGPRNTTRFRTQSQAPCGKPCSAVRIQRPKVPR